MWSNSKMRTFNGLHSTIINISVLHNIVKMSVFIEAHKLSNKLWHTINKSLCVIDNNPQYSFLIMQ